MENKKIRYLIIFIVTVIVSLVIFMMIKKNA